jgi:hypothetical protein
MENSYSLLGYPDENSKYGIYKNKYPYQAARKIFNFLSKKIGLKNSYKKFLVFQIINNKTGKIYNYQGSRIELKEPIVFNRAGKNFKVYYKSIVTKYDPNMNSSINK